MSFFLTFVISLKVILISQIIFGIFPVDGLRQQSSSHLSFKLKSFFFAYSTLVQCGIALMFSTSIYKQLNGRIEYSKIGEELKRRRSHHISWLFPIFTGFTVKFVFFILNFLVYFNFTMVAKKWPEYVFHWEKSERKLMELGVMQNQESGLKRRIKTVFIIIMVLAFSKILLQSFFFLLEDQDFFLQLNIIWESLQAFTCQNHVGTCGQPKKLTFVNHLQTFSASSSSTFTWASLHRSSMYFGENFHSTH